MPYYVLLRADPLYGRGDELDALLLTRQWTNQLEQAHALDRTSPRRREVRVERINFLAGAERDAPRDIQSAYVIERVVAGYRRAALLAGPAGRIGIAVGHGFATATEAAVDLAPDGWFRVDMAFLEEVWWHRQHPEAEDKARPLEKRAFDAIGQILLGEGSHRMIDRVDLYTCWVGHAAGQELLNALHHLWRVPVRGLRGPLAFTGNSMNPTMRAQAVVHPPPGQLPPRHGFGRVFEDQLIEGPGLWALSSDRPPLRAQP